MNGVGQFGRHHSRRAATRTGRRTMPAVVRAGSRRPGTRCRDLSSPGCICWYLRHLPVCNIAASHNVLSVSAVRRAQTLAQD